MDNPYLAASFDKPPGLSYTGGDATVPAWDGGDASANSHAADLNRIDDYCSRVDDELRASEERYPVIGLVVLASASALAMGLVGVLLNLLFADA